MRAPITGHRYLTVPAQIVQAVTPITVVRRPATQYHRTAGRGLEAYEQVLGQGGYVTHGGGSGGSGGARQKKHR